MMEHGMVVFEGNTNDGIDYYLQSNQYDGYVGSYNNEMIEESGFVSLSLVDKKDAVRTEYGFDEPIVIKIKAKVAEQHLNAHIGFRVIDRNEKAIFTSEIKLAKQIDKAGLHQFEVKLPAHNDSIFLPLLHHPFSDSVECNASEEERKQTFQQYCEIDTSTVDNPESRNQQMNDMQGAFIG